MAATIQTHQPTQQQQPNNKSSSITTSNPQLKRIVYSKYRELLGSYNDKANAIIDSLPAYMVTEDRGFQFDPQIIDVAAAVDNVVYGTAPAPPPLSSGSLPSQRLSTQIPQYNVAEAPACVQNAMMTKDKKPFTYTPGGIDLSQIKSQRMAKRLARNAQSEGATGQQQMHRPTQPQSQQQQSNGSPSPGVAASQLGATAMGMPFQVFPTGPPPPPPQPSGKVGGSAPPPPPPVPQAQTKLAPQSNGNAPRRSLTPQNFEPPPLGFRPEIKIPPNPMASLKKVPPPQEKNNFWMEEYRKERSKSPMVGNDENDNNRSSPNNQQPETNQYSYNNNQQNDQQSQYRAPQSPQPMRQQQQQDYYKQPSPPRTPVQQQQQQLDQQRRNESPYQNQYSSQQQQQSPTNQRQSSQYATPQYQQQQNSPQQQSPTIQRQISQQYSPQPQQQQQSPTIQRQPSQQYQSSPQQSPQVQRQQSIPTQPQQQYHSPQQSPSIQRQQTVSQPQQHYQQQSPTSPQYQQQQQSQQQQTSPTQQQSVPWRQQKQAPLTAQNNVSRPRDIMSPAPADLPKSQFQSQQQQQQQQQQYPAYLRSREALSPAPEQNSTQMSQPYQQKNAQVGSIYIPPVVNQQQQQQQYSPYQDSQGPARQQQQQQAPRQAPTNRWMNAQGQPVENQTFNRIKSPPPPQSSPSAANSSNGFGGNNPGLRLQISNNSSGSNPKERIIPIQLEQTPTPTRTPASAPGFGPQPFYNSAQQQQYSSVPSPPVNQGTQNNGQNSPNYVIRSPNQFVDQGYNQYAGVQEHPARVTSPQMQHQQQQQQSRIIQQTSTAGGVMTRIIPIAIESQPDGPLNPNNARGPISQQPIVIQNDPRNQNQWGSGSATPTQSKSFKILQKITDTSDDSALENKAIDSDGGSQYQEPQLQRPSYARQMTSTGQINSPNVEQMKRMQLNNEQAYANRARNQGTPPVMKQPQPNRYVSQRPVYSPDEHSQQYVHPSEQQVPEPKIYTGSAIPSRSFKILQAMTTPENAAESDSSDVVETDTSISECPCQQQQQHQPPPSCPYPYPYLPPCCTPPPPPSNSSSGGEINNWQYPYHHHPHPHPHHHPHPHPHHHHHHPPYSHHHPHQHHPYPYHPPCPCYYYNYPPSDYDSQNCSSRSSISSRGSYSRGRSQSQDLPKITITPSTDDVPQEVNGERMARNQREGSVIDILSQKLSEISKPDGKSEICSEKIKSPTSYMSESENDKVDSEESSEETSSESDASSSLSSEDCPEERSNEGLKAIRSVSNIQFYNKKTRTESEDDDRTIAGDGSIVFDEEEEEVIGEELEYDGDEVIVEEIDSEGCEEEEEPEEIYGEDDIIIMDDLSVIYEENESDLISPRPSSRVSSSVSETSTLANEEEEEADRENEDHESNEAVKKEDDEEDNSNSVTVRLPLKFSFSRSSNDENIATLEVGNSEIEDRARSFSIASIEAEAEDDYETDSQADCDVSVTISLSRSSDSVDKRILSGSSLSHISADVIKEEPKEENVWESDDEDVSVAFSLPMRNKFMGQTLNGDLTNNISMESETESAVEKWRNSNCELETEEKQYLSRTTSEDRTEEEEETEREGESSIDIQDEDEEEYEETDAKSEEELDFWATLQATRKEAQMFLEKTAGYWGKSVDGKEKADPTSTQILPKEEENDTDFWSNIRVKKEAEEPKPKTPKLKKKKKIIKKVVKKAPAPEPEPEPEIKLTIVKLPNANNKSKVVESAIQMIQEKSIKPKKLVKQVSKEEVQVVKAALENEIVQITKAVEEEKKIIEVAKIRRASLSMAKSIDEPKIEEVVIEKKEEVEDKMSKYVREKAELKTQILNQKFAKAFVIPNKPPLMKAVLSETESEESIQTIQVTNESSISNYCAESKALISETAISIENIKIEERKNSIPKVLISHEMESAVSTNVIEEPKKIVKKKITKAKAIDEDCDGNTLKPPTKKTLKKSTSTKKIKKKKEDIVIDVADIAKSKENDDMSVLSAKITSEVIEEKTKVVVQEETTVVMQNETPSSEEPDFWAEIEYSRSSENVRKIQEAEKAKATDPQTSVEAPKEKETDPWAKTAKNLQTQKSVDEEPDFWAEIDSAKTKKEQSTLVESSKLKTQQKVTVKDLQTLEWCNIESFAASHVKITAVETPQMMNGLCDYWLEEIKKPEQSQEKDFWLEIEAAKVKKEDKEPKKIVKKSTSTTEASVEGALKTKIKRKNSLITQEDASSSQIDESTKLKPKKKSSVPKEDDTTEAKPKTKKKVTTTEDTTALTVKTKKKSKSDESENSEKRSSIKLKSKKKTSQLEEKTAKQSKSSKTCNLQIYSDYDIELVHGEPEPVFYPMYSELDTGISFWATVSYTKEEEKEEKAEEQEIDIWAEREAEENSEVDSGKIDFWVTKRKFQTSINLNDDKPLKKKQEPTEEIDFWASNRNTDNFVENKNSVKIQDPAEEIDFWANNQNTDNFVENRNSVKTQDQAEKVDFWANNRNNDNFVENRNPVKTQDQTQEINFWANNRNDDNYAKTRNSFQDQPEENDFWTNNRNINSFDENRNPVNNQTADYWTNSQNSDNFEENNQVDFWANNRNTDNSAEQWIPVEEVDFWANNNQEEAPLPVKKEEPTKEVDFWAEIKEPNEQPAEDDCELRRNNYKKAMAFFTNTVIVEKKEKPEKKFVPLTDEEPQSYPWRPSVEPEWVVPPQQQEMALIVEDTETTEDEPTLVEERDYILDDTRNYEQHNEEEESLSSESISDSTPNHFQIEHLYPKPEPVAFTPKEKIIESAFNQAAEESKISVKDRIFAFETGTAEPSSQKSSTKSGKTSLSVEDASPNLSRNSSQRSESEIEEDDSGVTDMNKLLSETDTESESFPELRKMTPYQRASTHSRLFKLLQDDEDIIEEERPGEGDNEADFNYKPRKKIIHNVSITRKQNPNALQEAETVSQRRQRLSLPLRKNQSIDADNPSSPNSPASPIQGQQSQPISDKLVNELIQSLLLKKSSSSLKNLPMEKLQAAAKRVLEEELDSLDNTSLDSTPALTPQEFKNESYADYYDTWNSSKVDSDNSSATNGSFEILPSKAFKVLQETANMAKRKPWAVRCPRVLSSKTVNRDLARVTESPEMSSRSSRSPEMFNSERACSVGRWKKDPDNPIYNYFSFQ